MRGWLVVDTDLKVPLYPSLRLGEIHSPTLEYVFPHLSQIWLKYRFLGVSPKDPDPGGTKQEQRNVFGCFFFFFQARQL